jgi:hypothetical protein
MSNLYQDQNQAQNGVRRTRMVSTQVPATQRKFPPVLSMVSENGMANMNKSVGVREV